MMPISKRIKVKTDYSKSSHSDFSLICGTVCKNTYGNRYFPKPPIPFEVFRAKLDQYLGLIVLAVVISLPAALRKVKAYQIQVRASGSDPALEPERLETVTEFKGPYTITGLQPATRYSFQLRALGALGWTDWSRFCSSAHKNL